jgi:hypothetical protein
MAPGGEVSCTVDARDVYTAVRLRLDTRGLERVDLLYEAPSARYRIEDVPFDAAAGEIVFVQPGEYLRTLATERKVLRLIAVVGDEERVMGEYVLKHTAFRAEG